MGKIGLVSLAAIALCACEDSSSNATEPVPEKIEGATDVSLPSIDLGDYLSSSALASLLEGDTPNSSAIELPLSSESNAPESSGAEQPISSAEIEMSSGGVMPGSSSTEMSSGEMLPISSSSRIVPDLSSDSRPPRSSSSTSGCVMRRSMQSRDVSQSQL